jgi:hypothetical protein
MAFVVVEINDHIAPCHGHNMKIKKKIDIYSVYCSINFANLYEMIFMILNQSSGGSGIRLNTANARLINVKNIKKSSIKLPVI